MAAMPDAWLSTTEFAALTGRVRRDASRILARCHEGHRWQDHRLVVRTVAGGKGRGGIRYEVRLDSLPQDLKTRWQPKAALPAVMLPPSLPVLAQSMPTPSRLAVPAPGQASPVFPSRPNWTELTWSQRWVLIESVLDCPPRSKLRADCIDQICKAVDVHPMTLRRCARDAVKEGVAVCHRGERSDKGQRRNLVSRAVDDLFERCSIDLRTRQDISTKLEHYVRSLWRSGVPGWRKIQRFATKRLVNLITEEMPSFQTRQLGRQHRVPRAFIERSREFAVVHIAETDAKTIYNKVTPRIRRAHPGLRPMEMVAGDVHPIDIACRREDGSEAHPRMIAWLDVATRRVFPTLVLCEPGSGIRQEHVINSFIAMVDTWGLPSSLYLDNGGEYNWTHFIDDAMALTRKGIKFHVGNANNTRRALPYNARAKFIETFFAVWERYHASMLPGWRGGDRMRSKVANVGQPGPLWPGTFEHLENTVKLTIADYHNVEQSGALQGRSPNEAFALAVDAGWCRTVIDPEELATVFSREVTRVVDAGGIITIGNVEYEDSRLALLSGKRVRCRVPMMGDGSFISVMLDGGGVVVCGRRPVFGISDRRGAKHRSTQIAAVNARLQDMREQTEKLDLIALIRETASDSPPPEAPTGAVVSISGEAAAEAKARAAFKRETPSKRLTDVEKYHLRRQDRAVAAGRGRKEDL